VLSTRLLLVSQPPLAISMTDKQRQTVKTVIRAKLRSATKTNKTEWSEVVLAEQA
jgi:hypothetical protein